MHVTLACQYRNMPLLLWILVFVPVIFSYNDHESLDKDDYHPKFLPISDPHHMNYNDFISPSEDRGKTDWYELGQRRIQSAIQKMQRVVELNKPAKNVIFMMGDGLGISTSSAARVYMAQSRNLTGDDAQLSWERMPHAALSKTYSTDKSVADSAATATAMLCGEKTIDGALAVNQETRPRNCSSSLGKRLKSILHQSMDQGKWTGVVTTARITHASPAATYSHSADRDWEADSDLTEEAVTNGCKDIAAQLIDQEINQKIRVILGGGRRSFIPENQTDPEYSDHYGHRKDGRDLIQEWKSLKETANIPANQYKYVDNIQDFHGVDESTVEYLMGLFEPGHMQYELDRDEDMFGEPSLVDMVEKAIKILKRSYNGYFLFVEGGRVDHAHHSNMARHALHETMMLSDAVQRAVDLTSEDDTLIVVTADHSHVFTMGGYPDINTDILTFDDNMGGDDGKPYAILGYTNGPGYEYHRIDPNTGLERPRLDLTNLKQNMTHKDYTSDAGIFRDSETHGGEDVAIYARGPMAHLFHGTQEQSYIGHAMMYASCVGRNQELCDTVPPICPPQTADRPNDAGSVTNPAYSLLLLFAFICLVN